MMLISKDQVIIFLYRYLLIVNTSYIFNKEKIKMEYIIGIAAIVILGYLALRMSKSSVDSSNVDLVTPTQAPVAEAAPVVEAPAPVVVEAPAPVVEAAPVAEVPAKKPRKPRAPKVEQAPVKAVKAKAPAAKTTKAAVAKAPAKAAVKAVAKAPAKKPAAIKAKSKKA